MTPDANTLVVHAVLDAGVQHQLIIVQTTTGAVQAQRELPRAVVTIATPDGRTLTAVERHDTAAVNRVVLFPRVTTIYDLDVGGAGLIPGGTYQLRVVAPDGRTVTGRTTIPDAVASTTTEPAQTIDRTATRSRFGGRASPARGAIRSSLVRRRARTAGSPTRRWCCRGTRRC